MFPRIDPKTPIGFDYETSGLQYWQPDFRVVGVSVATPDVQGWYWDLRETPQVVQWLRDLLADRVVVAHNAQFEVQCTRVLGIDPRAVNWYCTMVGQCLINEHLQSYSLASVARYNAIETRKDEHLENIRATMGWKNAAEVMQRFSEVPADVAAPYGISDALDAIAIYKNHLREIERQSLERVVQLEMDLLPVLADMSWGGVRVNLEAAHASIPMLDEKEHQLQKEVDEIVGAPFNVNSSPQIRDFFKPEPVSRFQWKLIDGTLVGPTKGGKGPSLDQNAMREIKHPLAKKILDLRKTIKLRDTFIRGHVIGSADQDGYVHTSFNQTRNDADAGTVTGRLSSTDPALQQITKRDKDNAAILRAMFLPDPDELWLCADYSQVDFRCGAHLQNDPNVLAAYRENPQLDYHQVVSDMTGIPRNPPYAGAPNTKQVNLGLSFGAGQGKLAFMMGMPFQVREFKGKMQYLPGPEATAIFELYHKKLPAVKEFMKRAENVAKETGFVKTQIGRRLRFPHGQGSHKAAGLLYQAYAADLHKAGLVMTDRAIREGKLPARLMLSVHDEIGVSMPQDDSVRDEIVKWYTYFNADDSPIQMRVPIAASADYGVNWYEASKN